jgi:hypothetical protein
MSAPCPQFGFRVLISRLPSASELDAGEIADDVERVLSANDLVGERRRVGDGALEYLVTREGSQATDADRTLVRDWAARHQDRVAVEIGDLIDLHEAGG